MKKVILNILLFIAGIFSAQTSTENYIQSTTCLDAGCVKKTETVQYFDLLGRPKQIVNIKASPLGKDIVIPIIYDDMGRQTREYLPMPQTSTSNGNVYSQNSTQVDYPINDATNIYGGEKIYTEKILDNSPLQRVLQQKQVGNAWNNKPVIFGYDVNSQVDQVKKYETTTSWNTSNKVYDSQLQYVVNYQAGELTKSSVIDEDGNKIIEFKDGFGQTVLVRKILNATNIDTYYVYNEYMQLAYVIPPMASGVSIPDNTTLDNLCYQYKYDSRQRLVEKKLPGKGWEYMLYDKQGRLAATQDANLRANSQWMFTKYDQFSRIVMTGISLGSDNRVTEQDIVDALGNNSVKRTASASFNRQGMDVYYDNPDGSYPNSSQLTILSSLNYYDTYPPLPSEVTIPTSIISQEVLKQPTQSTTGKNTRSLPLAVYLKNIEDDNWTRNYSYYDNKGRIIGTYSLNYLGGHTKTETEIDFTGLPKQAKTYHARLATDTEKIITQSFEYDNQNRIKKNYHQVSGQSLELLAENTYNELSQLSNKKVGNNLQSIDYTYNIRGWMTKINDPSNLNGKLFSYEIKYTNPVNTSLASAKYNSNIAEIDWRASSDGVLKRYSYQYDELNRLKKGLYSEPGSSVPENGSFNEEMNYDLNGNIASLQRNSNITLMTTQVDNLSYTYLGNRLNTVTDNSDNYVGYPDNSGNVISYDDNGNMKDHKDKGILQIAYNNLDLPNYIKFDQTFVPRVTFPGVDSNVNTRYTYRTDGVKLKKFYTYGSGKTKIEWYKITEYLDGFQYELTSSNQFTPQVLKFVPTSEGYYNFENNKYIYNYVDHLGNVRVSYFNNGTSAEVLQENNFYPFGASHANYIGVNGNPSYKYQYNGKELQEETDMYDYGARFYMPDLGRWGVVDPLAEKARRYNPYNYAYNNPINFIDPDGRLSVSSLQEMWDNTVGSSTWTNSGNGVFEGGEEPPGILDTIGNFFSNLFGGGKKRARNGSRVNLQVGNVDRVPLDYAPDGSRLFGLIQGAYYNPMAEYRANRDNPGYNEGESTLDRSFRLMNSSHIEIMQDFGGGGYNMFGGYGRAAKIITAVESIEETSNGISKILSSTSEFDPAVTLFRGTTGSESGSSLLFLTDDAGVASSYIKNGGQLMKYEISQSGIYQLKYTGKLDIYKGINQGSNQISTEYKFIGQDVVNAVNKLATPHP